MGRATRQRQEQAAAKEREFQETFVRLSRQAKVVPVPAPLVDEVTDYLPFARRRPEDFVLRTKSSSRAKQVLDLARHLFGPYTVPACLEQAWGAYVRPDRQGHDAERPRHAAARAGLRAPSSALNPNLRMFDFRRWAVAVARGESLYKHHTKEHLTKRETHLLLVCRHDLSLPALLVWSLALAAGAPDGLALRLARSRLPERPMNAFWKDVVRFFAQPGYTPPSTAAVDDLVDYLAQHQVNGNWSIWGQGLTLASLTRRMHDWHRALQRAKALGEAVWEGNGLPDHEMVLGENEKKVTWTFHQITTGKELAAEGSAQRHCVLSYRERCESGRCSIWSLTRRQAPMEDAKRCLTIEMMADGRIVQMRGLANRLARPEEQQAVNLWVREFGLAYSTR